VKPKVVVAAPGALAGTAADQLVAAMQSAIAARGRCRLALAGGSTPRPAYEALARSSSVDWAKVHLFFGDERCVGPADPASNYAMAKQALLDRVPIPASQVFRIEGERGPEAAAAAYRVALGDQPLDVVLLGLGDDGHTASIFPATTEAQGQRVVATTSPVAPFERVSLTTAALSEAHWVLFLVSGSAKAARVAEVFAEKSSLSPLLPAARVRPTSGNLVWILDPPAASRLDPGATT
jgi:6-phosphogluconolactonase